MMRVKINNFNFNFNYFTHPPSRMTVSALQLTFGDHCTLYTPQREVQCYPPKPLPFPTFQNPTVHPTLSPILMYGVLCVYSDQSLGSAHSKHRLKYAFFTWDIFYHQINSSLGLVFLIRSSSPFPAI